jgi:cytochrome P450
VFLVTVGGHDATTHTFTWVIFFLAGNPDVQDWIHEEISQVLGDRSPSDWNYKTDFPRLKRCLAVLFETLRLYSPIGVAKSTGQNSVTLQFGDKTLLIPPGTVILPNHVSVHTDTRVWGSESLTWRPSRWIRSDAHNRDNEMFIPPIRGSFNGWADGPRDCPGEKLSQVDSVAVIALLFKSWTVNPVAKDGESVNEARERVRRFIVEDTGSILMTQMLHPERCPLVWTKR